MGDGTKISWTDATWNPVRGCSRVSEGCRHCYAETVAMRFSGPGQAYEGLVRFGKRSRGIGATGPMRQVPLGWSGDVRLVPDHLADPLRWRRPRRIFVNSMSDLFHEKLADEEIALVFGVMVLAAQHTYQVLTKRPERMRDFFAHWSLEKCLEIAACHRVPGPRTWNRPARRDWWAVEAWPAPWIWLGVSVENQAAADERIPHLLATPAAVRFLSCEPLLGPVDLDAIQIPDERDGLRFSALRDHHDDRYGSSDVTVSWVIAGCESGPGARAADAEWFRSLRDQCAAAGVPFFLKQAQHTPAVGGPIICGGPGAHDKRGGVIELPYLDGVQHINFPTPHREAV